MSEGTIFNEDILGGMINERIPLLSTAQDDKPRTQCNLEGKVIVGMPLFEHGLPFGPRCRTRLFLFGPGKEIMSAVEVARETPWLETCHRTWSCQRGR